MPSYESILVTTGYIGLLCDYRLSSKDCPMSHDDRYQAVLHR